MINNLKEVKPKIVKYYLLNILSSLLLSIVIVWISISNMEYHGTEHRGFMGFTYFIALFLMLLYYLIGTTSFLILIKKVRKSKTSIYLAYLLVPGILYGIVATNSFIDLFKNGHQISMVYIITGFLFMVGQIISASQIIKACIKDPETQKRAKPHPSK